MAGAEGGERQIIIFDYNLLGTGILASLGAEMQSMVGWGRSSSDSDKNAWTFVGSPINLAIGKSSLKGYKAPLKAVFRDP